MQSLKCVSHPEQVAVPKVASIKIDAFQNTKPGGFCTVGSRPIHRMATFGTATSPPKVCLFGRRTLILRLIAFGDSLRMTKMAVVAMAMIALTSVPFCEAQVRTKPMLKVRVDVSPSVGISEVEPMTDVLIAKDLEHLEGKLAAEAPVTFISGFAISAYENISILVSVTTQGESTTGHCEEHSDEAIPVMRPQITCGYLNDGTTYFERAIITDSGAVLFRLRNIDLLRRSMKLSNPLFVAYVFFLIRNEKEVRQNGNPMPVSTVTVEYL